jgi:hypothetical protein
MLTFKDFIVEKTCNCWNGYKRVAGTKPCAEGSCVKESVDIDEGATGAKPGWMLRQDPALAKKLKDQKARNKFVAGEPTKKPANEETTIDEAAVDAKGHKSSTGGLTQKGRDAYNAKGGNLQAPVTTPPSKLKAGSKAANRRKSFCARMSGVDGPMKKPNGEPTRKALALRKWNC